MRWLILSLSLLLPLCHSLAPRGGSPCTPSELRETDAACSAAAQQEEQTTHFAIALTGHVRSFMSDPLVATSLRLNLVQPLLRQRITPWLLAHVKLAAFLGMSSTADDVKRALTSLGAQRRDE